jgi:ribosomal protein L27
MWALQAKRSDGTERGTGEQVEKGEVGTAAREVESICGVNVGCGLDVDEW